MFNKISVVCVGNICRSPFAESVLKTYLPRIKINSFGLGVSVSGLENKNAYSVAKTVAHKRGFDLESHQAKQLTKIDCLRTDLILVMEHKHIALVHQISPESVGKVVTLGKWIQRDIPDPYRQSEEMFEHVFDLINEACLSWVEKLK